MPSDKPAILIRMTPEQHAAIEQLLSKTGDKSAAELGRRLFEEACKVEGVDFPFDSSSWGGWRGNRNEKK